MRLRCEVCSSDFAFEAKHAALVAKLSPVVDGESVPIPPPTRCPVCRMARRFPHRAATFLTKRPSSFSGTPIFSIYPPDAPFPVVSNAEWFADNWSALELGADYDPSRSFFTQLLDLRNRVAHRPTTVMNAENSDYCNVVVNVKDCYLTFASINARGCISCDAVSGSTDCIDCTYTKHSELCYDCVNCFRCYNLQSSLYCTDCRDSWFLHGCVGCSSCFGCVNLHRQSYCIYNQPVTKEAFAEFIQNASLGHFARREELRHQAEEFWQSLPVPHMISNSAEDVEGNIIYRAKSVEDSFFVENARDVAFSYGVIDNVQDVMDVNSVATNLQLLYECSVCATGGFMLAFCHDCFNGCRNLYYCLSCLSSEECFGCVGLQRARFCILNRQYPEKRYRRLLAQIIRQMQSCGEWGEFFPAKLCPNPYNHSLGQVYFPLSHPDALDAGYYWAELPEVSEPADQAHCSYFDALPNEDATLVFKSAQSGRSFKVTAQEMKRYRALAAPLPRLSFEERMTRRKLKQGHIRLYRRNCAKTGKTIRTAIPPEAPWIVWDKEAYDRETAT